MIRPTASETPAGVDLNIPVKRPTSFIVMAFAFYAAMALIGLSGLTIGALVFLGVRPLQPPMTGALAAMIFSIPALRGIMPGAPPLGVDADATCTRVGATGRDSWPDFVRNHLGLAALKRGFFGDLQSSVPACLGARQCLALLGDAMLGLTLAPGLLAIGRRGDRVSC